MCVYFKKIKKINSNLYPEAQIIWIGVKGFYFNAMNTSQISHWICLFIPKQICQETAARDGLMKMKQVYESNPALGDPMSIQGQLTENGHRLDKLRSELKKFQVHTYYIDMYYKYIWQSHILILRILLQTNTKMLRQCSCSGCQFD